MRRDLPFEQFDSVMNLTAAGFHDGQKAYIDLRSAWNPVVAHHEAIHERIFASSTDGVVLSSLMRLTLSDENSDSVIPHVLSLITQTLLDASRLAHEAAATYLAIRAFSPGLGDEVYERLPPQYLDYFEAMSESVERHFRGTFLQSSMAVEIWSVSFSSTYAKKILATGFDHAPLPGKDDLPDTRFLKITKMLKHRDPAELRSIVFEAATTTCRNEGHKPWDFEDDEGWRANIRQDSSINEKIEAAISAVTRPWLQQQAALPCVLDREEMERIVKAWVNLLRPWFPVVHAKDILDPQLFGNVDPEFAGAEHRVVEAYLQSGSKMTNSRKPKLGKFDPRRFEGDHLFENLGSFMIVSMQPPDHLSEWIFAGWPEAEPGQEDPDLVLLGRVDAATGKDWLKRWTDRCFEERKIPKAHSIVFAVRNLGEFQNSLDDMLTFMTRESPSGNDVGPGLTSLGWYWTGNWFDCVKLFASMFPLRYEVAPVKNPDGIDLASSALAPVVMFLKAPGIPGAIHRMLNGLAYAKIDEPVEALKSSGRIVACDEEKIHALFVSVYKGLFTIKEFWSEF